MRDLYGIFSIASIANIVKKYNNNNKHRINKELYCVSSHQYSKTISIVCKICRASNHIYIAKNVIFDKKSCMKTKGIGISISSSATILICTSRDSFKVTTMSTF